MKPQFESPGPLRIAGVAVLLFAGVFALRAWGISTRFQLLRDQIRDWEIALGSFRSLPLVGPATHVGGYTIGPAFYWILWLIRVTLGRWFENLPHAGGIGQAIIQSAADALLFVAIARRVSSMWMALATISLVATAAFDLSFGALIWNPVMGSTLAKMTLALILLNWHLRSSVAAVITIAVAWMAVHAYTGAIFVTVAAFIVALIDPLFRGLRPLVKRNALIMLVAVLTLQLPYLFYQVTHRFSGSGMGAVTESVGRVVTGQAKAELTKSVDGYVNAVDFIEMGPWHFPWTGWLLLVCAAIVSLRYFRDAALLLMLFLPPLMAIAGYALFLAPLDHYYYLSLMPGAVLAFVLAATAIPVERPSRAIAIGLVVISVAILPFRYRAAMAMNQMPQYGAIVRASRTLARRGTPLRSIRTEFHLPPTNDPEFVYRILGGRIDRQSPWDCVILLSGEATCQSSL